VLVEVLAHDERVAERPQVGLEVRDRTAGRAVGQRELQVAVESGRERGGIVADRCREVVDRLAPARLEGEPRGITREVPGVARGASGRAMNCAAPPAGRKSDSTL